MHIGTNVWGIYDAIVFNNNIIADVYWKECNTLKKKTKCKNLFKIPRNLKSKKDIPCLKFFKRWSNHNSFTYDAMSSYFYTRQITSNYAVLKNNSSALKYNILRATHYGILAYFVATRLNFSNYKAFKVLLKTLNFKGLDIPVGWTVKKVENCHDASKFFKVKCD